MHGFSLFFLTLARVALPGSFLPFLSGIYASYIEMEAMQSHFALSRVMRAIWWEKPNPLPEL
jgi:hypothetical protein